MFEFNGSERTIAWRLRRSDVGVAEDVNSGNCAITMNSLQRREYCTVLQIKNIHPKQNTFSDDPTFSKAQTCTILTSREESELTFTRSAATQLKDSKPPPINSKSILFDHYNLDCTTSSEHVEARFTPIQAESITRRIFAVNLSPMSGSPFRRPRRHQPKFEIIVAKNNRGEWTREFLGSYKMWKDIGN